MGVINPKRRIEEYIVDDKDIIFYNRIWNFEVMAGSYLAKNYKDLFTYEACVRAQLETNKEWKRKINVLPKGQSWARDGWLTDSKWSDEDFIFHGWQKRRLNNKHAFASWKLPILSIKFNISLCGTNNYIENWKYNQSFARDRNEIRAELDTIIALNDVEYYKAKQNAEKILANLTKMGQFDRQNGDKRPRDLIRLQAKKRPITELREMGQAICLKV
ncbi:hypothetical protein DINM_002957 [Dirofilaria immitis]|nr:hypothetical protein [Dirofilaria immitis]